MFAAKLLFLGLDICFGNCSGVKMTKKKLVEELEKKCSNAKPGTLVPIIETLPYAIDAVDYFAKLSDYGRNKNCVMFESASKVPKYGERSIGSCDPCLKIIGKSENFEITALNNLGEKFIELLHGDFDFCD